VISSRGYFTTPFSIAIYPSTVVSPAVDAGPDATIDEGDTFSRTGSIQGFLGPGVTGTVDYGDGTSSNDLNYYRFEEGTGTGVIDSVDGSRDGTLTGATYSTDVPVSTIPWTGEANHFSLQFDGTGVAQVDRDFVFNRPGDATLEFWLNVPDQGHKAIIWDRLDDTDANRFHIFLWGSSNGVPLTLGMDYRAPNGTLHPLLASPGPG